MASQVPKETTIVEIARFLEARRNQGQRPGLFLGHRAGGLFSNATLYGMLKDFTLFTIRPFDTLSDIDKFEECYNILNRRYSEGEIHQTLNSSLNLLKYREEDKILSALIKEGLFDTIITTNVDALLEDACQQHQGMKQPYDYKVIIHGIDDSKTIAQGKTQYYQVIKVFGDINLRFNTVGTEFDLEADQVLKEFLRLKLAEEILILGYDPIWDHPIEQAFLEAGKAIWFVNEKLPPDGSHLAHILNQREGKYLVGPQISYKSFLSALNGLIRKSVRHDARINVPPHVNLPHEYTRNKAFVSYSHKDSKYLDRLRTHVKSYRYVYGAEANLDCWDDRQIQKGAHWQEEIKQAIESARVAVLLVSADFLASDFIHEHEFPALLEATRKGKLTILAIIVGPCPFERTPLFPYQAMNGASKPLTSLPKNAQEKLLADVAEKICSILNLGE